MKLKKIVAFFKNKLYTSWVGSIYFNFLLWLDRKKFKKELLNRPSNIKNKIVYNQAQAKYEEGIKQIKDKIGQLAGARTKEEYERILSETQELIQLSKGELKPELEAIYKAWVYKGKDIKNDVDRAKMVDKRIQDFIELRKHKESRQALREKRKQYDRNSKS